MNRIAIVLAWLSIGAGCGGGSPYCVEEVTVLASLDEVSPLGWRGRDVLEPALGQHRERLRYDPPTEDAVRVDVSPPEATTDLEIEVTADEPEVRFVDAKVVEPRGPVNAIAIICPARVEVDARVKVRTGDGLLDETFDGSIDLEEPVEYGREPADAVPTFDVDLDFEALTGALAIGSVDPPDPDEFHADLVMAFEPDLVRGSIEGVASYDRGDTVMAGFFTIASWPADEPEGADEPPPATSTGARVLQPESP